MTDKERRETIIFLSTFPIRIKQEQKYVDCAIEALKEQRPHGQWICNEDGNYECSECGIAWKDMPAKDAKPVFKACPWCGADMRSEEGE